MAESHVVLALVAKRAEIGRVIARTEQRPLSLWPSSDSPSLHEYLESTASPMFSKSGRWLDGETGGHS
jgi:hypothetical protein